MNTLIEKITIKKAILFTVLFIACFILINYTSLGVAGLLQITNGASILDFEFGYSAEKAQSLLTALGEEGRAFHLTKIMPIDFVFPLSYMLCYSGWIAVLLKRRVFQNKAGFLLIVPVLAMIFDWIENIGIINMLRNFPDLPKWAVNMASISGILKMVLIISSVVAIVTLFVVGRLISKKKVIE